MLNKVFRHFCPSIKPVGKEIAGTPEQLVKFFWKKAEEVPRFERPEIDE